MIVCVKEQKYETNRMNAVALHAIIRIYSRRSYK